MACNFARRGPSVTVTNLWPTAALIAARIAFCACSPNSWLSMAFLLSGSCPAFAASNLMMSICAASVSASQRDPGAYTSGG